MFTARAAAPLEHPDEKDDQQETSEERGSTNAS